MIIKDMNVNCSTPFYSNESGPIRTVSLGCSHEALQSPKTLYEFMLEALQSANSYLPLNIIPSNVQSLFLIYSDVHVRFVPSKVKDYISNAR
jgi:hypothetical protein